LTTASAPGGGGVCCGRGAGVAAAVAAGVGRGVARGVVLGLGVCADAITGRKNRPSAAARTEFRYLIKALFPE
jgi:hypothetical protein